MKKVVELKFKASSEDKTMMTGGQDAGQSSARQCKAMASSSKATQSLKMDGRQMCPGSVLWSGPGVGGPPGWLPVGLKCLSWMVMGWDGMGWGCDRKAFRELFRRAWSEHEDTLNNGASRLDSIRRGKSGSVEGKVQYSSSAAQVHHSTQAQVQ